MYNLASTYAGAAQQHDTALACSARPTTEHTQEKDRRPSYVFKWNVKLNNHRHSVYRFLQVEHICFVNIVHEKEIHDFIMLFFRFSFIDNKI